MDVKELTQQVLEQLIRRKRIYERIPLDGWEGPSRLYEAELARSVADALDELLGKGEVVSSLSVHFYLEYGGPRPSNAYADVGFVCNGVLIPCEVKPIYRDLGKALPKIVDDIKKLGNLRSKSRERLMVVVIFTESQEQLGKCVNELNNIARQQGLTCDHSIPKVGEVESPAGVWACLVNASNPTISSS